MKVKDAKSPFDARHVCKKFYVFRSLDPTFQRKQSKLLGENLIRPPFIRVRTVVLPFPVCLFVCNRGNTILRHGGLHTNSNQCNQGGYANIISV